MYLLFHLIRSGSILDIHRDGHIGEYLQVQAHGGGLIKVKDTWYWYGESYKRPLLGDFLSEGVNLYSSTGEDHSFECHTLREFGTMRSPL